MNRKWYSRWFDYQDATSADYEINQVDDRTGEDMICEYDAWNKVFYVEAVASLTALTSPILAVLGMRSSMLNMAAAGFQFSLQVLHLFLAKSARSNAGSDDPNDTTTYCPPKTNAFFTGSAGAISVGITLV